MRDTPYATELTTANIDGLCIERLHRKDIDREVIRFSWWKDDNLMMRPLDISEDKLLPLMRDAMAKGVFTDDFLKCLQTAVTDHFGIKR